MKGGPERSRGILERKGKRQQRVGGKGGKGRRKYETETDTKGEGKKAKSRKECYRGSKGGRSEAYSCGRSREGGRGGKGTLDIEFEEKKEGGLGSKDDHSLFQSIKG